MGGQLHVVTTSYPRHPTDFAGHFVAGSVEALRSAGLAVRVWPVGSRGSGLAWGPADSLPEALALTPLRTSIRASAVLLSLRARLSRALQPGDGVVAHWLPVALAVADLAPTLAWAHGGDVALLESLPAGRTLARRLDGQARALAFVSTDLRDRFTALLDRRPRAPQWLLPMGVPPPAPDPAFAEVLRQRAGGRRIVATVGRLVPIKGLDVLAHALHRGGHTAKTLVWWAAGEGPEAARLAQISSCFEGLGVLTPAQRDALLQVADVFVLPSRPVGRRVEGTPVALLEALRSGVPSIASATGGVTALATAAQAVLVPPDDPLGLATAVAAILGDAPRAEAMGAAHRAAADRFAWSTQGPDHAAAAQRTLGR